jgi:hypothetical protein
MKFKSQIVTEASGSVGGLTASHNRGGLYFRARAIPVNGNTIYQQAVRNYIKTCAAAWSQVLTQPMRDAWAAYAAAVPYVDSLGEPRFIPPLAMYCACNVARLQAGLTRVDTGPTVLVLPVMTQPVYTVTAPSTGSLAFTSADAWANEVGGGMFLRVSRGYGVGINYFRGPYRYAGKVSGAASPPSSPASIGTPFAVVAGQRVFYAVRVCRADGRLSGPLFLYATAA